LPRGNLEAGHLLPPPAGKIGRFGHYYCETCGPAMLEMAVASGAMIEDASGVRK